MYILTHRLGFIPFRHTLFTFEKKQRINLGIPNGGEFFGDEGMFEVTGMAIADDDGQFQDPAFSDTVLAQLIDGLIELLYLAPG